MFAFVCSTNSGVNWCASGGCQREMIASTCVCWRVCALAMNHSFIDNLCTFGQPAALTAVYSRADARASSAMRRHLPRGPTGSASHFSE